VEHQSERQVASHNFSGIGTLKNYGKIKFLSMRVAQSIFSPHSVFS